MGASIAAAVIGAVAAITTTAISVGSADQQAKKQQAASEQATLIEQYNATAAQSEDIFAMIASSLDMGDPYGSTPEQSDDS